VANPNMISVSSIKHIFSHSACSTFVEGALHPQQNLQHKTLRKHHSQAMEPLKNPEDKEEKQFSKRNCL